MCVLIVLLFFQVIAANVAEDLVKKGLFEDAINMFDLAGVSKLLVISKF